MYVHGHALFICQLPNCNLFTQHAVYLMGETPLVNCGPRSYSLHRIQSTAIFVLYYFLQTIIIHTIHLILCYSKPVRLTTSLFRWGKVLWLCCAGSALAPESLVLRRTTSRRHQPSTCFLAPPGSINLGFFLRENLLLCASYLPLGVAQRTCEIHAIKHFFWRRCRGDQDTLQGESPLPNLFTLFLSCFILFTTLFAALNQNTKIISC